MPPNTYLYSIARFLYGLQKIFTNKNIFLKGVLHVLFRTFFSKCIINKNYLRTYDPLKGEHRITRPLISMIALPLRTLKFPSVIDHLQWLCHAICSMPRGLLVSNRRTPSPLNIFYIVVMVQGKLYFNSIRICRVSCDICFQITKQCSCK